MILKVEFYYSFNHFICCLIGLKGQVPDEGRIQSSTEEEEEDQEEQKERRTGKVSLSHKHKYKLDYRPTYFFSSSISSVHRQSTLQVCLSLVVLLVDLCFHQTKVWTAVL